jgi:SAM-dependent methyltransferase
VTDGYYEDPRHWSAELYETDEEQRRFRIATSVIPSTVGSLLDVGCGNGAFLRALESATSLRLAGVEPSEAARNAAVCMAPVHPGVADALPFDSGSFDAVSALEVLEHIPHPDYEAARREIQRVAREVVLVTVPYRERVALTRCPACGCRFHPHYHMRTFDERSMRDLFRPMRLVTLKGVAYDDYLGGDIVRAVYRGMAFGSGFPRTSVCPQCGLRGDEVTSEPSAVRRKRSLAAVVRHRLPTVRRPRWMVGVYSR